MWKSNANIMSINRHLRILETWYLRGSKKKILYRYRAMTVFIQVDTLTHEYTGYLWKGIGCRDVVV